MEVQEALRREGAFTMRSNEAEAGEMGLDVKMLMVYIYYIIIYLYTHYS